MSEPAVPPAPVTVTPRRMRQLLALAAVVVLAVTLVVAATLKSASTGVVRFGTADQVAIAGLGLIIAGGLLALGCPRVEADARGIRFRNIGPWHELPWAAVRGVQFERKSLWATLRLANGDEIAVLAVQVMDKERAAAAIEGLRALHAADRAAVRAARPAPPPLLHDN